MSQSDGAASRSNRPNQPRPGEKPTVVLNTTSVRAPSSASAVDRATALVKAQKRKNRIVFFSMLAASILVVGGVLAAFNILIKPVIDIVGPDSDVFQTPVSVRPGPDGTPSVVPTPPSLNEPMNILLLGLDERPGDLETRADTQIIVHVDPINKRAFMFSVPRDMWVKIPGFGEGRINTSYQFGMSEQNDIMGGGPALAMSTIEQNFGIRIHHYAQVNFTGFERVIDSLGGITLDVPRPLVDNEYPLSNYGTTRFYVPAGIQHMNGQIALRYARSRHSDSDFGRNYRQQQVLLALRQQGLNFDILGKLPGLANDLEDAVVTDLDFPKVLGLARLAQEIGPASIQSFVIEPPMVNPFITQGGAEVLMPDWSLIRPKIAELFADPKIVREEPIVLVLNGTTVNGMAARAQATLMDRGVPVTAIASAPDQGSNPITTVTDFTGGAKPNTIEAILKTLGLPESAVEEGDPEVSGWFIGADGTPVKVTRPSQLRNNDAVDIVITIGDDRTTDEPATPTAEISSR